MSDTGRILGRGISFPPRVGPDGRVAWSEGDVNVREAIRIILLTEQRERLRLPAFGGSPGSCCATASRRSWRSGSRASRSKR
jgi:uncharacterized protein